MEETFGPTLPVMKVRDAEEALRLANDSPYGLQASIYTGDTAKGERLARQVEAGVVTINDSQINYVALELPMGGWKASGLGSRHGADGIRKYTKKQTLLVTKFAPEEGPPHAALQARDHQADPALHQAAVRARKAGLVARLKEGDAFPEMVVESVDGPVELCERWQRGPLVVAFMRHFG